MFYLFKNCFILISFIEAATEKLFVDVNDKRIHIRKLYFIGSHTVDSE